MIAWLWISAPAVAQAAPAPPAIEARTVDSAARLGTTIYQIDRAAWVASDSFTAAFGADLPTGAGGWVVEPADAGSLRVTFYRGEAASARALFVASVRGGKVVDGRRITDDRPLTPPQSRLARSREIATAAARAKGYAPCTPAPFNTVVLPGGGTGPVLVYLLSPQVKAGEYPLGGHYRIVVGDDGKVLASRAYTRSCLTMPATAASGDRTPAGLFVTHLLDTVPTEVHVFSSYTARLPVFVSTGDGRLWRVTGGRIAQLAARR